MNSHKMNFQNPEIHKNVSAFVGEAFSRKLFASKRNMQNLMDEILWGQTFKSTSDSNLRTLDI